MKISQFFKDDTGSFSSQRLVFLTGFFAFFTLWIVQSLHELKVASIDNSVIYLLIVLASSKVGQSFTDNIKPPELKDK
jgi:hypothetical protein